MQPVLLSWALQGVEIKHIDEVENGLKCNCVCPQCNGPLIARNRGEIKRSHFAHTTDTFCAGAEETALHLAAKHIIYNSSDILTPEYEFFHKVEDEFPEHTLVKFEAVSNR